MRLLLLLLLNLLLSFTYVNAQIKLGVQGGYGLSKWNALQKNGISDYTYQTKKMGGLNFGIVSEINLSQKLIIRPGIFLTVKGTILDGVTWFDTSSEHIYLDYVELPVSLMYKIYEHRNVSVSLGGGAYAAYCYVGAEIGAGTASSGPYKILDRVVFGNRNKDQILPMIVEHMDFGYTINSSIQWRRFQFLASYEHGLKDLLPNPALFNNNFRNSTINFSIAYFIFPLH
jgi:hypothetical protein